MIESPLSINNKILLPKATYPQYPPYHRGFYLEEYFYDQYVKNNLTTKRKYIDVYWTNIYCNQSHCGDKIPDIQKILNKKLDPKGSYFTICQHDDGPKENLPNDTLIFSAGGNRTKGKIIPIPLICSPIPKNKIVDTEKKWLASFVGSYTSKIRKKMISSLTGSEGFYLDMEAWSPSISEEKLNNFISITSQSIFALCPRGYGKNSFRISEAMQLNSIPVIISDSFYLPWSDEIKWEDISVMIGLEDICNIEKILRNIEFARVEKMQNEISRVYQEYFTMDGVVRKIIKKIENEK